jgi:hypothetical protein
VKVETPLSPSERTLEKSLSALQNCGLLERDPNDASSDRIEIDLLRTHSAVQDFFVDSLRAKATFNSG